jgi:anti-anti-sigma factor
MGGAACSICAIALGYDLPISAGTVSRFAQQRVEVRVREIMARCDAAERRAACWYAGSDGCVGRIDHSCEGGRGVRDSDARSGFSASPARRASSAEERERGLVPSPDTNGAATGDSLAVEAHAHRRTALVALRGELDLVTVSKVAEMIDDLDPQAAGVRHIVLDLRGLTFMDVIGLRELIEQNEYARSNRHNLAVVRGTTVIQRVLELTGVAEQLVLVDDPDDLVPPPLPH